MGERYKLAKHNRIEKTKPKLGKSWCRGCDRSFIGDGEKCPICGNRQKTKHAKK